MSSGKLNRLATLGGATPASLLPTGADAYSDDIDFSAARSLKAKSILLADILPDPAQPRRAVPSAARAEWDGRADADSVSVMLGIWVRLAERELGAELPLYIAAEAPEDYRRPDVDEFTTPITYKLLRLLDLANDINGNGLVEPIHLVSRDGGYRIESGERRWLAHWWLFLATRDEKWLKISAFIRDALSVWRQASENGARQHLNAIGLTRQLALLLMDIHQQTGTQFERYEALVAPGDCDRAFYAQVADGAEFRVPRGWGEKIVAAMGLSHTQQLRQYRALLRLPNEIWVKGDDQNWTEGALRPHTVASATVSPKLTPRQPTEAEKGFSDTVRTMLLSLRTNEAVSETTLDKIEQFLADLRATGRVKRLAERR